MTTEPHNKGITSLQSADQLYAALGKTREEILEQMEGVEIRFGLRPGLVSGVSLDRIDIAAGLNKAAIIGYDDPTAQMVAEYALNRWSRGEEDGADRTWLAEYPNDLTSWRMILAAAVAKAQTSHNNEPQE